jgi:hypothetical protein
MLSQDTFDVRLKCCFHFPLRILKTATANSERQLLANSVPAIVFRVQKLQSSGTLADTFNFTAWAVMVASIRGLSPDQYVRSPSTIPF